MHRFDGLVLDFVQGLGRFVFGLVDAGANRLLKLMRLGLDFLLRVPHALAHRVAEFFEPSGLRLVPVFGIQRVVEFDRRVAEELAGWFERGVEALGRHVLKGDVFLLLIGQRAFQLVLRVRLQCHGPEFVGSRAGDTGPRDSKTDDARRNVFACLIGIIKTAL